MRKLQIVLIGAIKVMCLLMVMASALSMFIPEGNGNEMKIFVSCGLTFITLTFVEKFL